MAVADSVPSPQSQDVSDTIFNMRVAGIILNAVGIIISLTTLISFFYSLYVLDIPFTSVETIGGENGPTSVFYTAKLNHNFVPVPFILLFIFSFNLWSFLRNKKN